MQTGEIPKNAKVISQSSTMNNTIITLIDLDNNEIVILNIDYEGGYRLFRTGITCDPNKQIQVSGNSAPFQTHIR